MLDVLLHTMAISGLSRVRTEFDPLLVVPSLTHHPVQAHRQSSRQRDFGRFPSSSHHQVKVFAAPLWQAAHCDLRRFHQQKTQHGTALFGNVSQSAAIPAGVFQRHQSEIARHLLPALKAVGFSDDQFITLENYPDELDDGQWGVRYAPLLQLRVLCLGLLQDGDVRVGFFPEDEEILVSGKRPNAGSIGIGSLRGSGL
jgi:hypothetical protein